MCQYVEEQLLHISGEILMDSDNLLQKMLNYAGLNLIHVSWGKY